jgi:hypothetical protein
MSLGRRLISTEIPSAVCTTDSTDPFGDSSGVALYNLDYDASTAPDGTDYSGSPTNVTFGVGGQINYGARFNGSSSYISIPATNTTPIDFSSESHTFSVWVNVDNISGDKAIISKWHNTTASLRSTIFYISGGNIKILEGGSADNTHTSTGTISANAWTHIVYTRAATESKIYINGSLDSTHSRTATIRQGGTEDIFIGFQRGGFKYFDGDIDQVRIFNRALDETTSGEISALYAETACVYTATTDIVNYPTGTTPVAYYKLDNSSEDFSTGGNDGTESNIEYRFGRFGQAAVFDGSSSYISIPALPITTSDDVTFSAWVKGSSDATDATIVSTLGENGLELRVQNSAVRAVYRKGSSWYGSSTVSITADAWNHVVLTYEQGVGFNIYVNNNTPTAYAETGTLAVYGSANSIGKYANGSSGYFDGSIDQVRIFSTALTSDQVTELYNEKPETDTSTFKTVLYEGTSATQYISNVGIDLRNEWWFSLDKK